MTFTEEQFERIVREVMRRLGVARVPTQGGWSREANHGHSAVGELVIDERVVTMRSIEGRLNGITRMVVRRKAVVTPAVRDELKQRKVELVEAPE